MEIRPLITIITISYQAEEYIQRTIESILGQNYTNIEYIIVDGNSTDGTISIIKDFEPKLIHTKFGFGFYCNEKEI